MNEKQQALLRAAQPGILLEYGMLHPRFQHGLSPPHARRMCSSISSSGHSLDKVIHRACAHGQEDHVVRFMGRQEDDPTASGFRFENVARWRARRRSWFPFRCPPAATSKSQRPPPCALKLRAAGRHAHDLAYPAARRASGAGHLRSSSKSSAIRMRMTIMHVSFSGAPHICGSIHEKTTFPVRAGFPLEDCPRCARTMARA